MPLNLTLCSLLTRLIRFHFNRRRASSTAALPECMTLCPSGEEFGAFHKVSTPKSRNIVLLLIIGYSDRKLGSHSYSKLSPGCSPRRARKFVNFEHRHKSNSELSFLT